jgi:hypothetical protein
MTLLQRLHKQHRIKRRTRRAPADAAVASVLPFTLAPITFRLEANHRSASIGISTLHGC